MSISHLLDQDFSRLNLSTDKENGFLNSPLRIFPQEILIAMFLLCIDPIPFQSLARANPKPYAIVATQNLIPHNDTFKSILDLCHVCREWRSTILCTPAFWSSFSLQADNGNKIQTEAQVYASLSGSYPLSFSLSYKPDLPYRSYSSFLNALKILSRHSHRWTHIAVAVRRSVDAVTLSDALPIAGASLQTLAIIYEDILLTHRINMESLSLPKIQVLYLSNLQGISSSHMCPHLQEFVCSEKRVWGSTRN